MTREIRAESGVEPVVDELKSLLKGRAESYEIFFSHDKGFSAEAKGGSVESLKLKSLRGAGVRVISKGRLGFGFSSVLSKDALKSIVDGAVRGSLEAAPDEFLSLPMPWQAQAGFDALGLFDESFGETSEDEAIARAAEIESSAMSFDSKVKRVRKASYSESLHSQYVVNSNGVESFHAATFYSGSVTAVAEDAGESQMGWEVGMDHRRGAIDPAAIGSGAARNAVRLLGARKIETVRCPAVMENTVACELLEALSGSFLGDNVIKGKSLLAGKAGQRVASTLVTIWDDGIMPGGWASSPFDGEGVARQRTPLVSSGTLNGYLYDTYWARRAGAASTGNAARSSFKGVPGVGVSNIYIEKGGKGFDGLIKDAGTGLLITELLGVHTINTISGEFSLGAAGFWIEGGSIAYPVRGMAVAGDLLTLFSNISGVGSDLRFFGSVGSPSLLISEIEASGS